MGMSENSLKGIIVKGIAGFYYVKSGDAVYRCKARGIFKQRDIKPAVGDEVTLEVIPGNDDSLITDIMPRRNSFIRPFISNVDRFVIVTAPAKPAPVFSVIDKFLVMAERAGTDIVLCVNKCGLIQNDKGRHSGKNIDKLSLIREIYEPIYPVVYTDCMSGFGIEELRTWLTSGKTALAGPSGVGKSTILNRLLPEAAAETGVISEKSGRGKHTTRHSELFTINKEHGGMIFDTPGFTSFDVLEADEDELQHYYPEIERELERGKCRYSDCRHVAEPGCAILKALEEGRIHKSRYDSYKAQLEEIKKNRQY